MGRWGLSLLILVSTTALADLELTVSCGGWGQVNRVLSGRNRVPEVSRTGFVAAAEKIAGRALDPAFDGAEWRDTIETAAYNSLSHRDISHELQKRNGWIADSREYYDVNLSGGKYPGSKEITKDTSKSDAGTVVHPEGYTHIPFDNYSPKGKTTLGEPPVAIVYKSYYTVPIDNTQYGYNNFAFCLNKLPRLFAELHKLNEASGGAISQIKVPSTMDGMAQRVDSIVIHYDNPELQTKVDALVRSVMGGAVDVPMQDRPVRGPVGFDFVSSNPKFNGSHGQLLSRLIAKKLAKRGRGEVGKTHPEELGRQIEALTREMKTWSPEAIYKALTSDE